MVGNSAWGMHKFRSDLMVGFIKSGHQVIVIAPKDDWTSEIEKLGCDFIDVNVERKGTNPFADFKYLLKLLQAFLSLKPDIVLAYTIKPVLYGSIAGRLAGASQVVAITTGLGYIFSVTNFISRITKILYLISLKFAHRVWFLNAEDMNTFLEARLVDPKKAEILPGEGVDVDYFQPQEFNSSEVTFTLISRMLRDKGVGLFAECAEEIKKENPEINFQIVGPVDDGNPEAIPLKQLLEWHERGHIRYLGSVNDIRPILKKTSCLVHPTFYKEGLPRVLMEANAMGIPCITTDIPGCRDVILDSKNGFIVPPLDRTSLLKAIKKFLQLNNKEKEELGRYGREHVVNLFSSNRINGLYKERLKL